jgi:CheY-like chemotaxis protein
MRITDSDDMGNILVVDDDVDTRETVAWFLTKAGYAVRASVNGRDALIAIATMVPDVIVLDARMPEMSGVEFLQVIRSYLRWSTVPVVLLTAYDTAAHIDRARDLGVKCIFLKATHTMAQLASCIEELMIDPMAQCSASA